MKNAFSAFFWVGRFRYRATRFRNRVARYRNRPLPHLIGVFVARH